MIYGAPCKNAFLPACRAFLPALFDCVHVHVYMPLVLKTRGNHSGSALFFKKRKGGGTRAATHCIGKRSWSWLPSSALCTTPLKTFTAKKARGRGTRCCIMGINNRCNGRSLVSRTGECVEIKINPFFLFDFSCQNGSSDGLNDRANRKNTRIVCFLQNQKIKHLLSKRIEY